jgi:hypothetical protein
MGYIAGGVNPAKLDETAEFGVGDVATHEGNEYVYCSFAAAEGQYEAVAIDKTFAATSLTTTVSGNKPTRVGIVQVATTAGSYAWALVKGSGRVKAAASCAADVVLYTTATAGVVDDASTDKIVGLRLDAAVTTADDAPCTAVTYMYTN